MKMTKLSPDIIKQLKEELTYDWLDSSTYIVYDAIFHTIKEQKFRIIRLPNRSGTLIKDIGVEKWRYPTPSTCRDLNTALKEFIK